MPGEEKKLKSDPHDHHDHLPKDVLNNEQDPESFKDPLEVELAKSGKKVESRGEEKNESIDRD